VLKTTEDIERFTELYQNPNVAIDDICKIFGYAPGSVYRMGFELSLKRPRSEKGMQLNLKYIRSYAERVSAELPAIPGKDIVEHGANSRLDYILLLSDEHAGRYTKSTNGEVFAARISALAERIIKAVRGRTGYTERLHIFKLGDSVTGERVGLNVTLEELEHTVLQQCYGLAIPHEARMVERLLTAFSHIDIVCVPGNHGVVTRPQMSKGANWDTVVSLGLQAKLSKFPQVTVEVAMTDWYAFHTVRNLDWMLMHGDQNKGSCNYNSIASNITSWHKNFDEHFDYVAMGHFHHFCKVQDYFINGTLLTDDDWSREVVKRDGECVQLLIAVSSKGIEEVIPIWLNDVREEAE
jgi:hypothetical protein